jgi:hypothetical protein
MTESETGLKLWRFSVGMAAKLAGGMVGVSTTTMTANPFLGTAIGMALAHTLERVDTEVVDRRLAPRQNARVGRAIVVACIKLKEHQDCGRNPRNDGFFDEDSGGRSSADEVTEATLLAAMNSAQEQKVDFIAALLANIAVNPGIDVPTAHLLIELANALSYRAFSVMRIAGDIDAFHFETRTRPGEGLSEAPTASHPLMVEIFGLSRRGVIELKDSADSADTYAVLGFDEIDPAKMRLSTVGQLLHDNLELSGLDTGSAMYLQTVEQLRRLSRSGGGSIRAGRGTLLNGGAGIGPGASSASAH